MSEPSAIVIGAGPAGLMAAEVMALGGLAVTVIDRMPSPGRKLLMAGRGGLNLTHTEPFESFIDRYGAAAGPLRPVLDRFTPAMLRAWCEALGQPTFVGTSGRVFPKAMKASPLLRAWMARLTVQGVQFRFQQTWKGWGPGGGLVFDDAQGIQETTTPSVLVLALGGASWPRLGSDGRWTQTLSAQGIPVTPLAPANVGFDVAWSPLFRAKFAGKPLKAVGLSFGDTYVLGEAMISKSGLQGGGIYALSRDLRQSLDAGRPTVLTLDLRPSLSQAEIRQRLERTRPGDSLSNRLRKAVKLGPLDVALLREVVGMNQPISPEDLARLIKALPLNLTGAQSIDRAISSAGGVRFEAVNPDLMLTARPGVFLAGEMLDWEAPTGGYLLQACFATGRAAGEAALSYVGRKGQNAPA